MNKSDILFCFVKFGKKEYMEKLIQDGELYFNTSSEYNKIQSVDNVRGDDNEGAEMIINKQLTDIRIEHPSLGSVDLKPNSNQLSKLIQYNYSFLSYSLLAISSRTFSNTDKFQIDKRFLNMEKTDTAVFITDPYRFLKSVSEELKKENLAYKFDFTEYKQLDQQERVDLNPFVKKKDHQYQMEYRLIIPNESDCARNIQIGSIADYCHLVTAESMIETTWNVK